VPKFGHFFGLAQSWCEDSIGYFGIDEFNLTLFSFSHSMYAVSYTTLH